jgi:hypothetical protein
MPRKLFVAIVCLVFSQVSYAQPRSLRAVFTDVPPHIDGVLDDEVWKTAERSGGFIMDKPNPGKPHGQFSEVAVMYDNQSVYVGFWNYDTAPDSILRQLCGRDKSCNTDYCAVTFSCFQDGVNGFTFIVSPNGTQGDARVDGNGMDLSWNAVWYSPTSMDSGGWYVEYKVPFAALRFPDKPIQEWNINFERDVRRTREHAYWNTVDPLSAGELTQMGVLTGIENVKPPLRFFLYPYGSTYYDRRPLNTGGFSNNYSYNFGTDIKLGLTDAFTLDQMLIPDFGQVISDQKVLNLSAYEVVFADNRQFFTEGTELFNRGNVFYSRRVGYETPYRLGSLESELKENEVVSAVPSADKILSVMKVSGRNTKKLGIGVFNAVTRPSYAEVSDTLSGETRRVQVSNFTNYNIALVDQILPNNSYLSLLSSQVNRAGSDRDASVFATEFDLRNKANSYAIKGGGSLNSFSGEGSRWMKFTDTPGYTANLSLQKLTGNWQSGMGHNVTSDTYDCNDLGYLAYNNERSSWLYNSYNIYEPFGKFNRFWSELMISHNMLYNPSVFTSAEWNLECGFTTRKFFTFGAAVGQMPVRGFDYFEPRVWGKYVRTFRNQTANGWISTDYRKALALDVFILGSDYENSGRYRFNYRISPRIRFSDKLFVTYVYSYQSHINDIGFAFAYEDQESTQPLFSTRDVISHTNVLTLNYAFGPFMTSMVRWRHYWAYTDFKTFHSLGADGYLGNTDVVTDNLNFNTMTIDCMFQWIFTPGSELNIVWKYALDKEDNDIAPSLTEDLNRTVGLPAVNSISVRCIFFVDYLRIQGLFRGKQPKKI